MGFNAWLPHADESRVEGIFKILPVCTTARRLRQKDGGAYLLIV